MKRIEAYDFGTLLQQLRKQKRLSQTQLATRLGLGSREISFSRRHSLGHSWKNSKVYHEHAYMDLYPWRDNQRKHPYNCKPPADPHETAPRAYMLVNSRRCLATYSR